MEAQSTPSPTHEPAAAVGSKPNGPVAAVLIAVGVGVFTLGLLTTLAEASTGVADFLEWSKRVGPLSGKTDLATTAFLVSWLVAYLPLRGKDVDLSKVTWAMAILVALGLIGTFPPFFQAFASE